MAVRRYEVNGPPAARPGRRLVSQRCAERWYSRTSRPSRGPGGRTRRRACRAGCRSSAARGRRAAGPTRVVGEGRGERAVVGGVSDPRREQALAQLVELDLVRGDDRTMSHVGRRCDERRRGPPPSQRSGAPPAGPHDLPAGDRKAGVSNWCCDWPSTMRRIRACQSGSRRRSRRTPARFGLGGLGAQVQARPRVEVSLLEARTRTSPLDRRSE